VEGSTGGDAVGSDGLAAKVDEEGANGVGVDVNDEGIVDVFAEMAEGVGVVGDGAGGKLARVGVEEVSIDGL
jgi:hypothetical protein